MIQFVQKIRIFRVIKIEVSVVTQKDLDIIEKIRQMLLIKISFSGNCNKSIFIYRN